MPRMSGVQGSVLLIEVVSLYLRNSKHETGTQVTHDFTNHTLAKSPFALKHHTEESTGNRHRDN